MKNLQERTNDSSICRMDVRPVTPEDMGDVGWLSVADGWWRIDARLTCAACGAVQEADSDPTNVQEVAVQLTARLFNSVGWRVATDGRILCPDCTGLSTQDIRRP